MGATDRLISFSLSDVGRTRKENQDACGEFRNERGERLLVVADGMGGHAGGVTASRLCIESVARVFESGEGAPSARLRRGLEEANHAVFAASEADPSLRGMGTTGVALLFDPEDQVWLGWVGDSRAYRYKNGQLEQLSDDHSVVADWVRQGVISAEEAETHPRRNELTRAIGPDARVDVDIKSFSVEPGDIYLLCSDGLCGYMSDAEISAIVGFEDTESAVRKLVDTVNDERNSPDNVTVQIVTVPDGNLAAVGGAVGAAEQVADEPYDEEYDDMADGEGEYDEGSPRAKRMLFIGIALLIVIALLAGVAWYSQRANQSETSQADLQQGETSQVELEQTEAERLADQARRDAELEAARAAEAEKAAEAARLEAKATREEEARLEAERLAIVAREEEAAREAALAKEIADAKAALLAEQAALEAEAAQVASAQAAERERILAEQERRRREEIAAEEARAIEIAFNMAREVDEFVNEWMRALDQGDYILYKELGFRESESEFRTLYPDDQAAYEIAVLEKKQWVGGFVALRVNEIYDPPGQGPGEGPQQVARRLVLRPTSNGLRFAGDRN